MAELIARITLEDNVSTQIIKPIEAINKLKEGATSASESISSIAKKKVDIDASNAINKIKSVNENVENITKRKYEVAINAIDKTKSVASKVKGELNILTKAPATVAIKAKDETTATISKIKEGLMSLKTLALSIVLGATFKSTIGAASQLEQEQIAMKHFIGYNNQKSSSADVQKMTDDYISKLRVEANATPFSTNEIISAGRRAVNVTSGDTKQAMDLVKLSESMAALNPGKSVMDAMEALADAKTGEYERMKEFGSKITQADVQKAGGTDKYFKTQFSTTGAIGKVFTGGADELSKTTAGNWSTVTGNLESIGANFGKAFLPVINKILTPLASLLDKNADKFTNLGESIVKAGNKVGSALTPAFNIMSKTVEPAIISVTNTVAKYLPEITKFFMDMWNNVSPYLKRFGDTLKTYVVPIIKDLWGKVQAILPGVGSLFKAAFEIAAGAIKIAISIFEKVAPVIKTMYDIISPILDGVIWLFDKVAGAIKTAVDWLAQWNGTKVEDKTPSLSNKPGEYNFVTGKKNGEGQYDFATGKKDIVDNGSGSAAEGYNFLTGTKNGEKHGYNFITGKAYASGTDFAEGGLSLVGELGPELVNLPKGAQVINNKNTTDLLKSNGIASQFAKTGEDIPTNLAKGIKKTTPNLMDSMSTMTYGLIQNFGTGITENSKYPIKSTNDLSKNVAGIFTTLGQQSNPLGQSVSQGLGQGIQDSGNNVVEITKTLTDKVITAFQEGFDIHSPSRKTYTIGLHTIQGFINGLTSKNLKGFIDKHVSTVLGAFGASVNVPGGVSDWLTQALMATGTPLSWLPGLQRLVMAESGGDPGNWNPQAVGSEHATGLLQTLPSTFSEFMQKGMNNILNPVDNAASAINYIKSRYGDVYSTPLFRGGSYSGYADGTNYASPGWHYINEKGPELVNFRGGEKVISNKDSQNILGGKDIKVYITIQGNVIGNEEFADEVGNHIVTKVRTALQNM